MDHLPGRQRRDRLHLLSLECCLTRKMLIRNAFYPHWDQYGNDARAYLN